MIVWSTTEMYGKLIHGITLSVVRIFHKCGNLRIPQIHVKGLFFLLKTFNSQVLIKVQKKPGGTKMSILNSPIKIGDLTIKNRLVMPPMATAKATDDGQVTKQICDYYHEKSFGGYIELIITENPSAQKQKLQSQTQVTEQETPQIPPKPVVSAEAEVSVSSKDTVIKMCRNFTGFIANPTTPISHVGNK